MGLKHSGKSTQGKIVADMAGIPFVDTDMLIEEKMQMSAREIYAKKGAVAYVMAEQAVCEALATEYAGKNVIIAAGGGICDNPPALNALRGMGTFVFLNLDIKYSIARIENKIVMIKPGVFENAPSYVLAKNPTNLVEVHQILLDKFVDRVNQYKHIADICVDIENSSVQENSEVIYKTLF